jgi:2-oxoglutarate dehydrogenase E2 component (dihydrolipoamide succinyltransferase)
MGESVTEAVLLKWHKNDGEAVKEGEPIAELETDKANVDVPAPASGVFKRTKKEGDTVKIGETIATIDPAGKPSAAPAKPQAAQVIAPQPTPAETAASAPAPATKASGNSKSSTATQEQRPSVRRLAEENKVDLATVKGTGPGGRIIKEDVIKAIDEPGAEEPEDTRAGDVDHMAAITSSAPTSGEQTGVRRQPMSKIRKRIAENLVRAQQTAAILTTFNEIDLHNVMEIRAKYKERFEKIYNVGLGFMSFFARAVVLALKEFPRVNAQIDGNDIIYHDYVNLGIAVSTERGLAVPVLRNVEQMSFAKIETEIKRLAAATRDGKLSLQELSGGTFTVTNGGVFGSLLSTPIINPPQSAILGMHAIQKRPVVVNDEIKIRPMMYVALSYDHRIIDGRESVSFLVRVKELLESPDQLLAGREPVNMLLDL